MTSGAKLDLADPRTDPRAVASAAAHVIAQRAGADRHDIALVLGSGWKPAAELFGEADPEIENTDVYAPRLRDLARALDPSLEEGVYVQFPSPHDETPAEVRMARTIGGDLVAMSTTLEAITAREAGLDEEP